MSSAGHILDSIKKLKANRALTARRGSFNIKEANTFKPKAESEFKKYRFRKASPEYLKGLKLQLSAERKRELIKQTIILLLSVAIGLIIFYSM
ncbi:hypothetical protein [Roseivirga thermotolerans]|uniref:hypothetical protein n=1 Tax=Roseivirga thermotolerans TaxID=1758176 RepID=UPI00273F706D|nr:hypothetical protein [Roseivirga thermotolerans]